jgi:pyruvate,water dikinase
MLDKALRHVPFSEERALWQLIAIGSARVPLLALGRKLVQAGVIDQPDDVFFLRLEELRELAATPRPMQDAVAQRRARHEHDQTLTPPQSIGAPLIVSDRPRQSQIIHRYFFGTIAPPSEANLIRGSGASQGVVRGRARVVSSLTQASRLQPGEILVCRTTAPPWTPLFAVAAGVVTETGGILSHSAICAREYAIPCVVGTQVATSRIPDGATITVDGTRGTVTIEI